MEDSFQRGLITARVHYNISKLQILEQGKAPSCTEQETETQGHTVTWERARFQCGDHWPCCTASPKSQILMHTHRARVTLATMGTLMLMPSPSGVSSALIFRMRELMMFNLCESHNFSLAFLGPAMVRMLLYASIRLSIWASPLWPSQSPYSEV